MAQEKAEHARVIANERTRTAEARWTNQARSVEIRKMKELESKLRAEIKTHEEAARSQQQVITKTLLPPSGHTGRRASTSVTRWISASGKELVGTTLSEELIMAYSTFTLLGKQLAATSRSEQ